MGMMAFFLGLAIFPWPNFADNSLVGNWETTKEVCESGAKPARGQQLKFTYFSSDGQVIIYSDRQRSNEARGTYSLSNDTLTVHLETMTSQAFGKVAVNRTRSFKIRFEGGQLITAARVTKACPNDEQLISYLSPTH